MKVLIVGLGVQGKKRLKILGKKCIGTVDKINKEANFKSIYDVNLNTFDTAFICVKSIVL